MTAYNGARKASTEAQLGLQLPSTSAYSSAIAQGFQVVNGLHDAARNHSVAALNIASDASDAMEKAQAAHRNGEEPATVVRHLELVDNHINNLGRTLGESNDASNLDPAVTYAQSPGGSTLAETYAKECTH